MKAKFKIGQHLICVLHGSKDKVTVIGVHYTKEDGYRFQTEDTGGNGWWGPKEWFTKDN